MTAGAVCAGIMVSAARPSLPSRGVALPEKGRWFSVGKAEGGGRDRAFW
jgi:hypothetical protein